jgi:hypothetical protein
MAPDTDIHSESMKRIETYCVEDAHVSRDAFADSRILELGLSNSVRVFNELVTIDRFFSRYN